MNFPILRFKIYGFRGGGLATLPNQFTLGHLGNVIVPMGQTRCALPFFCSIAHNYEEDNSSDRLQRTLPIFAVTPPLLPALHSSFVNKSPSILK